MQAPFSRQALSSLVGRLRRLPRPLVSTELLAFAVALWIAITCNQTFLGKLVGVPDASAGFVVATLLLALTGLHAFLLGIALTRRTARPVLGVVVVVAATAAWYVDRYGVYLDPSMVRNALHTQTKEAADLVGAGLVVHLLTVALPALVLIALVRIRTSSFLGAALRRVVVMTAMLALVAGSVLIAYPWLAAPIRAQHELRYQITPANLFWSVGKVALDTGKEAQGPRLPVALDAERRHSPGSARPLALLLVVGETARAANWGLNGYARDTTPLLRDRNVINFSDVTACGTDTETSLPCMFAQTGRRDYNETRIRRHESLLHVLARAGFRVSWRDNQTGCKGVCDGLPFETIDTGADADCQPGRCLDGHLLDGLETRVADGDEVIVLHMIGSHGPAYDHRYPADQAFYQPVCGQLDIRHCDAAAIVNSYDNSIRYTDQVLAQAIDRLEQLSATHDTALLYVSDHGESLGENRLYLHGIPWRIAPDVQRRVPMVMWFSDGFVRRIGLDAQCLRRQSAVPVSHDHLFHTVLGLLDVATSALEPELDLVMPCRRAVHRDAVNAARPLPG